MRLEHRHQLIIVAATLLIFFANLGAARLWDEDETEYSRCAVEMMERGDWVMPTLNYTPWSEKPAFVYWLMIGSFHVFGVTEFAARFPSAVMAVGAALATYHVGRRLYRPEIGFWAAMILSTTLMFVVVGRAATMDATLIFVTTLALWVWVVQMGDSFWQAVGPAAVGAASPPAQSMNLGVAHFRQFLPQTWLGLAGIYFLIGVAVLVKGPIGVVLPALAIGAFVLLAGVLSQSSSTKVIAEHGDDPTPQRSRLARRFADARRLIYQLIANFPAAAWAMRPISLALIVGAVALPWYVLVGLRTEGEYWWTFFWVHNIQYLLHPNQGHNGSVFYYLPALAIGFFPWTVALVLGIVGAARRVASHGGNFHASLLALVWGATWFGVFTLCGTKLPHYLMPAYPLLAIMASLCITEWIAGRAALRTERLIAAGWFVLAAIGLAGAIAMPIAIARFAPGMPSYAWVGGILLIGATLGWQAQRRGQRELAAATLVVSSGAFMVALLAVAGPPFSQLQTSLQITERVKRLGADQTALGMFRVSAPGFIYYADRHGEITGLKRPEDIGKFLSQPDPGRAQDVVSERLYKGPFVTEAGDFLLVTDEPGLSELRPLLPPDSVVLDRVPRFLKAGEIVLIGRKPLPVDGPHIAKRPGVTRN